jgi:hypothetical protein
MIDGGGGPDGLTPGVTVLSSTCEVWKTLLAPISGFAGSAEEEEGAGVVMRELRLRLTWSGYARGRISLETAG